MNRMLDLCSFGIQPDDTLVQTDAIQKAFDSLAAGGGGTLYVPKGTFCSGALMVPHGVNLTIDGTLKGSADIKDYPIRETRYEGRTALWPDALLNVIDAEHFVLDGTGSLDGNGIPFYAEFWKKREEAIEAGRPFVNHDVPRPRLLYVAHGRNITIRNVHLVNSGFWNIHLYDCEQVVVEGVTVTSPHGPVRAASTDGIDLDASRHVVVRDCTFSVDDDCICLKGGKGPDAHLVNPPTSDILVERCTVGFGHGVVTFGSEACRVSDVTIRDMNVTGENQLVRFKFREDTDQLFERIRFEQITMQDGWVFSIRPWISRQDEVLGKGLPSVIRGLVVQDVTATDVKSPGVILADPPQTVVEGLEIRRVRITTAKGGDASLSRHDRFEETEHADPHHLSIKGVGSCTMEEVWIDGAKIPYQGNQCVDTH
ncbi:MAG: glycosyl hydrolase family 28 protein [Sphaerochaeta sp.]|jgi:polygalacturonase|nr:glycosyl hydrolase family 28 protein [Sphaerochaeta sp.]